MSIFTLQAQIPVVHSDPGTNMLEAVNREITEFEEWFKSLGNEPLSKPEAAILRTYFAYKLKVGKGAETPTNTP